MGEDMHRVDLAKYQIHSDLIIDDDNITHTEEIIDNITVSRTNNKGNYITLSFDDITDTSTREMVAKKLEKELKNILIKNKIKDKDKCLIIGLGNRNSTPDSLGVRVLDNIIVTAHIANNNLLDKDMRSVATFSPGVMANTGMESAKIILSLVNVIKPDFIIAIDSLASSNVNRLNKTIQITDTGIHPGAGIGNKRVEISHKTIGIPVIAVGVPTVLLSSTIVYDTIYYLFKHIAYLKDNDSLVKLTYRSNNYIDKIKNKELSYQEKSNLLGLFGSLDELEQQSLINEVLDKLNLNLIVTPTEIDFLVDKLSCLIALSINNALHRQIMHL